MCRFADMSSIEPLKKCLSVQALYSLMAAEQ